MLSPDSNITAAGHGRDCFSTPSVLGLDPGGSSAVPGGFEGHLYVAKLKKRNEMDFLVLVTAFFLIVKFLLL